MKAAAARPLSLQLAGALRPLWRWWSGEIAALTPAPIRRWLAGGRGRLVVTLEGDHATILEDSGGGRRRLGSLDLARAEPGEARRIAAGAKDATLELPAGAALRRVVALPAAAEANLAEVVSFELERPTPFRRADGAHRFPAVGRDRARQRIVVELTVVPRTLVDGALARLVPLGLEIAELRVAGERPGVASSPDLLPARPGTHASRLPRLALAGLAATAALLAVAAVTVPLVRLHQEAARLEASLATAEHQAAESARLQKAIDDARAEDGFLAARKRRIIPVSQLLDVLTRLLPDNTWLSELRIAGSDLELAGSSASASHVIALIDDAPGLSNAAFRSPVTQDAERREAFDIGARIGAAEGR